MTTTAEPMEVKSVRGGGRVETWGDPRSLDPHRTDGPARITYREDGTVAREEFYLDGSPGRADGGPTVITYYLDGKLGSETWERTNGLHRVDGPAAIDYDYDGSLLRKTWVVDDEDHRLDGPSEVRYGADGEPVEEWWRRKGLHSRIDGPSYLSHETGERDYYFAGVQATDLAGVGRLLLGRDLETIRFEIEHSSYAPLLAEGFGVRKIASGIAEGVRTVEGFREFAAGAPAEWVRSWEDGIHSR